MTKTLTFRLEPAAVILLTDGEPDVLYEPGMLKRLLDPTKWKCARFDFDSSTYYFTRRVEPTLDMRSPRCPHCGR